MKVCDHENPTTVAHVLERWQQVPHLNIPIETGCTDTIEATCGICGAEFKATLTYTITKPGKSRKTHRLWALLKGVA